MRSKDCILDIGIWRVSYKVDSPNAIKVETFDGEHIDGNKWDDDQTLYCDSENTANLVILLLEEAARA